MNAEEYSTKNAKGKDDIFDIYNAFKAGEQYKEDKNQFLYLIQGLLCGFVLAMILLVIIRTALGHEAMCSFLK